jgi:hypothetical protein
MKSSTSTASSAGVMVMVVIGFSYSVFQELLEQRSHARPTS